MLINIKVSWNVERDEELGVWGIFSMFVCVSMYGRYVPDIMESDLKKSGVKHPLTWTHIDMSFASCTSRAVSSKVTEIHTFNNIF